MAPTLWDLPSLPLLDAYGNEFVYRLSGLDADNGFVALGKNGVKGGDERVIEVDTKPDDIA